MEKNVEYYQNKIRDKNCNIEELIYIAAEAFVERDIANKKVEKFKEYVYEMEEIL